MLFAPGQVILRRYVRLDTYTWVQPMQVVSESAAGLLLWHPVGSQYARLVDADGRTLHDASLGEMRRPRLAATSWTGNSILVLMPPETAYSVWWFFNDAGFTGWYVNLEDPHQRHEWGVETTDAVLDLLVTPDRSWRWKDEAEFVARTGHAGYFSRAQAAAIRTEGERLVRLAEEGAFPFDGIHTDFRPDPAWPVLRLPSGWDQLRRAGTSGGTRVAGARPPLAGHSGTSEPGTA
jgi:protein associated with RNAse G/E